MGVIEICHIFQCSCITVKAHRNETFKTSTFLHPLIHEKRCALNDSLVPIFILKIDFALLHELEFDTVKHNKNNHFL